MNAFFSGIGGSALFFVLTVGSGILLSLSGKPYHSLIFNLHKLIAVGAIIIIVRNIYRLQHAAPLKAMVGPAALLIMGLLFVILLISGGVLSMQDGGLLSLQMPLLGVFHRIHQVAPILALAAGGLSLLLLTGARV